MADKLAKYKSMRTAGKTSEPFGDTEQAKSDPQKLVFVVQKHSATALHYDFRLEAGGVMSSWAIPKGPTLDSGLRRLAMKTEDHPLDYRHFEGEIPQGEYGGGQVIIWDCGTYVPEIEATKGQRDKVVEKKEGEKLMLAGIEKGEIKFFLSGKRLKGSFALVRTKGFPPGVKNAWLLIKHKDEYVREGYDAKDYVMSVVSDKELM